MSVRLRPDARALAAAALLVAVAVMPAAARPRPRQAANPGSLGDLLDRVSRYVAGVLHAGAEPHGRRDRDAAAPSGADLSPDGFARRLVYDLRFEWTPDSADREAARRRRAATAPREQPAGAAGRRARMPRPDAGHARAARVPAPDAPRRFRVHRTPDRRSSMGARRVLLDYKPRSSGNAHGESRSEGHQRQGVRAAGRAEALPGADLGRPGHPRRAAHRRNARRPDGRAGAAQAPNWRSAASLR